MRSSVDFEKGPMGEITVAFLLFQMHSLVEKKLTLKVTLSDKATSIFLEKQLHVQV